MSGRDKIDETPQQRALSEYAMRQLQDYRQRWLPVQAQLADHIQAMGAPDSPERRAAQGKNSTDTAITFGRTNGAVESALASKGINLGSSRAKLALSGVASDQAKTRGIGSAVTDSMIDDAYTQGLQALTAIGRGERANVNTGMAQQARTSAQEATTSAEISAQQRAGNAEIAGQAIGGGLYAAMQPSANPGYTVYTDGMGINNTGTSLPTRGGK